MTESIYGSTLVGGTESRSGYIENPDSLYICSAAIVRVCQDKESEKLRVTAMATTRGRCAAACACASGPECVQSAPPPQSTSWVIGVGSDLPTVAPAETQ
jgi:hypothetical protein